MGAAVKTAAPLFFRPLHAVRRSRLFVMQFMVYAPLTALCVIPFALFAVLVQSGVQSACRFSPVWRTAVNLRFLHFCRAQRSIPDFCTFAAESVRVMRFNISPICRTLRCILHHLRRLPLVFIPSIPPAAPQTIPITRAVTAHAPKLTVCDASPPISQRINV